MHNPDTVKVVLVNTEVVGSGAVRLNKGQNRIVLVWSSNPNVKFNRENAGCFLRIIDPQDLKAD